MKRQQLIDFLLILNLNTFQFLCSGPSNVKIVEKNHKINKDNLFDKCCVFIYLFFWYKNIQASRNIVQIYIYFCGLFNMGKLSVCFVSFIFNTAFNS